MSNDIPKGLKVTKADGTIDNDATFGGITQRALAGEFGDEMGAADQRTKDMIAEVGGKVPPAVYDAVSRLAQQIGETVRVAKEHNDGALLASVLKVAADMTYEMALGVRENLGRLAEEWDRDHPLTTGDVATQATAPLSSAVQLTQ